MLLQARINVKTADRGFAGSSKKAGMERARLWNNARWARETRGQRRQNEK